MLCKTCNTENPASFFTCHRCDGELTASTLEDTHQTQTVPAEVLLSNRVKAPDYGHSSTKQLMTFHSLSCPPLPPIWLQHDAVVAMGRDSGCDVILSGPWVSRRHSAFSVDELFAYVRDLGSSNGTYLNGEPVEGLVKLEPGDIIIVGGWRFTYQKQLGKRAFDHDPDTLEGLASFPTERAEIVICDDEFEDEEHDAGTRKPA